MKQNGGKFGIRKRSSVGENLVRFNMACESSVLTPVHICETSTSKGKCPSLVLVFMLILCPFLTLFFLCLCLCLSHMGNQALVCFSCMLMFSSHNLNLCSDSRGTRSLWNVFMLFSNLAGRFLSGLKTPDETLLLVY